MSCGHIYRRYLDRFLFVRSQQGRGISCSACRLGLCPSGRINAEVLLNASGHGRVGVAGSVGDLHEVSGEALAEEGRLTPGVACWVDVYSHY